MNVKNNFIGILSNVPVPTYAGGGRHCSELMDDVSGEKVDIVVAEWDPGVPNALSHQLVELAVV